MRNHNVLLLHAGELKKVKVRPGTSKYLDAEISKPYNILELNIWIYF